jgi:hypothetical protein
MLGVVLVGLVASGVLLYVESTSVFVKIDPATLCPVDRPPAEVMVILLDMSSQLSKPQELQARNELIRVEDGIPTLGLVEVYAIDRIGDRVTEPTVRVCNPGSGQEMNRLYQNRELARKKWQEFHQKLSAELDRQLTAADAATSPIFEAVQAAALRTFGLPKYDKVPKHLIIVSDLLQHIPGTGSHYRGVPDFAQFKSDPYFAKIRANLDGVKVTLFYLIRSNTNVQGRKHVTFWEQYFSAQGAKVEAVTTVYGDQ